MDTCTFKKSFEICGIYENNTENDGTISKSMVL